jgi:hypothetical protein
LSHHVALVFGCVCLLATFALNAVSGKPKQSKIAKKKASKTPTSTTRSVATTTDLTTTTFPVTTSTAVARILRYSMCDLMSRIDYSSALPEWSSSPIGNVVPDKVDYFYPKPVAGEWVSNEVANAERGSFCYTISELSGSEHWGYAQMTISTKRSSRLVMEYDDAPLQTRKQVFLSGIDKPVLLETTKTLAYVAVNSTCQLGIDTDHGALFVRTKITLLIIYRQPAPNDSEIDPRELEVACSASETLLRLSLARLQTGLVKLIPVVSN